MSAWLIEAMAASALLMLLVLAIRRPVARTFGAQAAYALWALPLLRMLLPPLPSSWRETAAAPIATARETLLIYVVEPTAAIAAPAHSAWPVATIVLAAWGAGASLLFVWHAVAHAAFVRRLLAPPATHSELPCGTALVETSETPGPVAFGVWHRFVAVPAGFAEAYPADERALALAHELGHHARGDLIANWAALALLALHWFNPLAWVAYRAFRADQEMANDARVLAGRSAVERHAYACAIVRAARSGAVSAACHLHSIDDLKGRLKMLSKTTSRRARAAGAGTVAALALGGLALTASGTAAAESVRAVAAALPVAAVQAVAAAPSVVAPAAPAAVPAPPPPPAAPRVHKRVIVVRDGKTTTYNIDSDDTAVADLPVPPVAPRVMVMPRMPDVPQVVEGNCGGSDKGPTTEHKVKDGRPVIVICTKRIERMAADAARAGAISEARGRTYVMNSRSAALHGLRGGRAAIQVDRNLTEDQRKRALEGVDQAIREMEAAQANPGS